MPLPRTSFLRVAIVATAAGLGGIGLLAWSYVTLDRALAGRAGSGPRLGPADTRARDALLSRGRALLESADYAAAVSVLDRALETSPGDAEALALQVRAFRAQRQLGRARAAARRILDRFPDSPLAHLLMGSIAVQEGDAEGARRSFERALELDSTAALAIAQLASLDMMEGRVADARRRATQSLALDPAGTTALRTLFLLSRSVPELISLCERLIESGPDDRRVRAWLEVLRGSRAREVNRLNPVTGEIRIPCEAAEDGRLYVRGAAGSSRGLRFLLDTGASGLILSESVARRMGMRLREFSDSAGVGGLTRHSHPILLDRLDLDGAGGRDLMATASILGEGLDGILNPLVLAPPGSGLTIEIRPAELVLILRKEKVGVRRPGETQAEGWVTVPFLRDGNHVVFHLVLSGRSSTALLDTGAAADIVDRPALRGLAGITLRPAPEAGTSLVGFGGRIEDAQRVDGLRVRIAGIESDAPALYALDLNRDPFRLLVDLDAVIGMRRLSGFDIKIDPSSAILAFRHRE